MDQKPFAPAQPSAWRRLRIRNIIGIIVLLFLGYRVLGPARPPAIQETNSPVYLHDGLRKYWPGFSELKHIIFFGDSYTSTRFLPANAPPSESNPFGNPPFPGNVSHKRPLWSDYLVTTYNESLLTAINLAWGGATVDDRLIVPFIDVIEGLNRQVGNNYLDKYAPNAPNKATSSFAWNNHDTLVVFWFGINDVQGAWLWENRTAVLERDLATYRENVEQVYQTGARNFLFFNIPPIERAPLTLVLTEDLQNRKRAEVLNWNEEVAQLVRDFTKKHRDVTAFWWDAYRSYNRVLDAPCSHPETCGLKDLTTACPAYALKLQMEVLESWEQSDPSCPYPLKEYFWMDELHHGYHMHAVTAQGVVQMLKATPKNYWPV
ncbi:carbohydrate esterase family 16 [Lecanosticta acicola]|uniref:Carbohydrate esterase family 16 n=1 Tax=Lecanosticta acicola TaxID=111012 RepID=A0AAI8Z5L1_9PEZI|nr:carbohydrate esterase family 16 [Lecanosticta acicola]